ncbi:MAG TPA: hypothetical protein VHE35_03350 [Kofleriaceae bacterium]|nr:hypothetical protein [Kofleriaceae bacterium]
MPRVVPALVTAVTAIAAAAMAACEAPPFTGAPADGPPLLDGRWTVSRKAYVQPAGCRELHPADLIVTFHTGGTPAIELTGATLEPQDQSVTTDSATFVTEDHAFPDDPLRPVLLTHQLRWLNDELTGTAQAMGDGDDLGCTWNLQASGIHLYD